LERVWGTPGFDVQRDTQVVVSPEGQIVGYSDIFDPSEPHVRIYIYGRVHPDHTGKGIGSSLLEWGERRARQSVPKAPPETRVILNTNLQTINRKALELFENTGFKCVRESLRMCIELDQELAEPSWPEGIQVRAFERGRDEEAVVQADREAFSDHWGYIERPFESDLAIYRHHWFDSEDFIPELCFLAVDGTEIAGFTLNRVKVEEDPKMAWIGALGVRRAWRRQGIGLALLLHSFGAFRQIGKARVGLGVDAESLTGATKLYLKAGMHPMPEWQWSIMEKELREGLDLSKKDIAE
jgi:mycothiol synthase